MLKLPPLSALRAFEAVSRLGSVTRAAEELHVTHSAISHQLKLLEEYLSIRLIDRSKRRVHITPEGWAYAFQVRMALQQISGATRRISMRSQSEHLTIAVLPSFATHWLVPRLSDFYAQHPNWKIELIASLDAVDFEISPVDCAIRFGSVKQAGTYHEHLMSDWLLLVASAQDEHYSLTQSPSNVIQSGKVIIANENWAAWCLAAGIDYELATQSLIVNDSNIALEAARGGLAAVLTRLSIADAGLRKGNLKRVTSVLAKHPNDFYLVWPSRSHQTDKLMVFLDWLKAQCRIFEDGIHHIESYEKPTNQPFGFLHTQKLNIPLHKED